MKESRRIVIGGPKRPLLEGLKDVAARSCNVLMVSSNFTVIQQAVRLLSPDLAVIDCGEGCWEFDPIVERLGSISTGLRILAFLPDALLPEGEDTVRFGDESVIGLPASASEERFRETLCAMLGETPESAPIVRVQPAAELRVSAPDPLTPRQRDILSLICSAESTKSIARILGISTRTVEFHKYRMMKALSVNTMAELILFGVASGMGTSRQVPARFGPVPDSGSARPAERAAAAAETRHVFFRSAGG